MIKVTKINGEEILVNDDLIDIVEHHGDSVISLTTGNKVRVKDSLEDIQKKVIEFNASSNKRKNVVE